MSSYRSDDNGKQPRIAIIGAGLGGICMAIKLKKSGYRQFLVFEKAASVGGTWRDNTYPGVACDVPSHLYSYSFELNANWSRAFSPGWEIQRYSEHCVDRYDIRSHLRLDTEVTRIEFVDNRWCIVSADGTRHEADFVISGMGGLHRPKLPEIPGKDTFAGEWFHSARWNHDCNLDNQRVAIIGSAASAVQIVPAIADQVSKLYLFQRTPNWIIPNFDKSFSAMRRGLFRWVPGLGRLNRWVLYWIAESRWPAFRRDSVFNRLARYLGIWQLRRQVPDRALRKKLLPDYAIGCKRILRSDNFYPTLSRDHVELITTGIDHIDTDAVVTADGTRHVVDIIVYATGFNVFDITGGTTIVGPDGQTLAQRWASGIAAHRTVTVTGMPNFFMLQGPNSGLGHNSVIFMLESQSRYIVKCINETISRGWRQLEPLPEEFERFQVDLKNDLDKTIWHAGCNSWYLDPAGRNFTLWPHTATRYWYSMRHPDMREFHDSAANSDACSRSDFG